KSFKVIAFFQASSLRTPSIAGRPFNSGTLIGEAFSGGKTNGDLPAAAFAGFNVGVAAGAVEIGVDSDAATLTASVFVSPFTGRASAVVTFRSEALMGLATVSG